MCGLFVVSSLFFFLETNLRSFTLTLTTSLTSHSTKIRQEAVKNMASAAFNGGGIGTSSERATGSASGSGGGVLGSFVNLASLVKGTVTDAMEGVREQGRYRKLLELVQAMAPSISFVSHVAWSCPSRVSQWMEQNRVRWEDVECVDTDLYLRLRPISTNTTSTGRSQETSTNDVRPNAPCPRTILLSQRVSLVPLAMWSAISPQAHGNRSTSVTTTTGGSGELVSLPVADLLTDDQVPGELSILRRRNQLLTQFVTAVHVLHVVYLPQAARLFYQEASNCATATLSSQHPWANFVHSFHGRFGVVEMAYGGPSPPLSTLVHLRSTSLTSEVKMFPTAKHLLLPLACHLPGMAACTSAHRAAERSHIHGHRPKGVVSNAYFGVGVEQRRVCRTLVSDLFQDTKMSTQHEIELMRWCDRLSTAMSLHFAPPLQFPALDLIGDLLFLSVQLHIGPWFQCFDSRVMNPFDLTWPSLRYWNRCQVQSVATLLNTSSSVASVAGVTTPQPTLSPPPPPETACIPLRPLQTLLAYWTERYNNNTATFPVLWCPALLKGVATIRDQSSHMDIQQVQGLIVSNLLS